MTGADRIARLRRAGKKPPFVWVTDTPTYPDSESIHIAPTDVPEALDLRCLIGTTVIVDGADAARVQRIAAACAEVAERVIASTFDGGEVARITDTAGEMTWQK